MPGYIIHLAEAEIVIRKLRESDFLKKYSDEWERRFLWGCLAPDAEGKDKKESTHFWNQRESGDVKLPDLSSFVEKYADKLRKRNKYPEIFGYFTHLYLDRMFWDDYVKNNVQLTDKAGFVTNSHSVAKFFKPYKCKQELTLDLFRKYLYEDYTQLNYYLSGKYPIHIPDEKQLINELNKPKELQNCSLESLLEKLDQFLQIDIEPSERGLKIIDLNSFDIFLELAAESIIKKPEYACISWIRKEIGLMKNTHVMKKILLPFKIIINYGLYAFFILLLSIIIGAVSGKQGIKQLQKCSLVRISSNSKEKLKVKGDYSQTMQKQKSILDQWIREWEKTGDTEEEDFADFVKKVYFDTINRYEKNKNKNFLFKSMFISVMISTLVGFVVFCVFNMQNGGALSYIIAENSILLVVIILALTIISKWLDIKKYQETWVRHYNHLYMLEKEMRMYLYRIGDYKREAVKSQQEIKDIFMKRFFEIEDENTKKFCENMENKEIKIGEGLKGIF